MSHHEKEMGACQHYKGKSQLSPEEAVGSDSRSRSDSSTKGRSYFITGRRQAELDKAAKEIGTNVIAVMSDVSRLSDLDLLYKEVAEKTGNIYA
jgi:hypothetical protein